jgi:hypothetical protein
MVAALALKTLPGPFLIHSVLASRKPHKTRVKARLAGDRAMAIWASLSRDLLPAKMAAAIGAQQT